MPRPYIDHGFRYASKPCVNCDREIEREMFFHWEAEDVYLCVTCLQTLYEAVFTLSTAVNSKDTVYRKQPIPDDLRWRIWERDDYTCRYCGRRNFLSIDHVIPESRGGSMEEKNLVTACRACNSIKNDRTPDEAGMKLRNFER